MGGGTEGSHARKISPLSKHRQVPKHRAQNDDRTKTETENRNRKPKPKTETENRKPKTENKVHRELKEAKDKPAPHLASLGRNRKAAAVTEVDGHQPSNSAAAAVVQEEEGANPTSLPPLDSGKAGTGGTNPTISPPVSASPAMRAYFELSEMAISNIGVEAPAELKTEILTRNDTEIIRKEERKTNSPDHPLFSSTK